jgi:hypothetical protein
MPSGSSGGSGGGARGGGGNHSGYSGSGGSGSGASSGGGGRATVFDSGEGGASVQPKGIIDAVEDIQRLYVLESRADQDLPYDFFSFKQVLDFAWIGFRGAIVESLLFFLIFPVALTVYPAAKLYFTGAVPTLGDYILPFVLSYSTIIIMTIYVMSAARYYKGGTVTRKAIHSLFTGRSIAFAIKASATSAPPINPLKKRKRAKVAQNPNPEPNPSAKRKRRSSFQPDRLRITGR